MTLREKFEAKGYSVTKFARRIGVSQPMLSLFLNGKLKIKDPKSAPKYQKIKKSLIQEGILCE